MTEPVVSMEPSRASIEPGGQAEVVVTITNPGDIVDGYRVDIIDEVSGRGGTATGPARWSQVFVAEGDEARAPAGPKVSVYPQQRQDLVVVLSPGSGPDVSAGTYAFGVRVASVVDPSASAVVEGTVEIARVTGLEATLVPVTSTGRRHGVHEVLIANRGNSPVRLRLIPSDPDQSLAYRLQPEIVDLPIGGSATARLEVRPRNRLLVGQVKRSPFSVLAEPVPPVDRPGPASVEKSRDRIVVEGAFAHQPILTRGIVTAAGLVAAAAIPMAIVVENAVDDSARSSTSSSSTSSPAAAPPPAPVMADPAPSGPTALRLTWRTVPDISGYKLLSLGVDSDAVDGAEPLDKAISSKLVTALEPNTTHCFRLVAVRDKAESPPSKKVCGKTAEAPVTESPAGGGAQGDGSGSSTPPLPSPVTFANTDWIALVYVRPTDVPGAWEDTRKLRQRLDDTGVPAQLLLTSQYPTIAPPYAVKSWAVWLGPFNSADAAVAACSTAPDPSLPARDCLPAQPRPSP